MLDADLAIVYGVSTGRLMEQVKRNIQRFPQEFLFQLTPTEKAELIANCDNLARALRYAPRLPYAFTEHGALMAATVLNSPAAVHASIEVIKAFVRFRELLSGRGDLLRRLDELERKYDAQFKVVFQAIRQLMEPPAEPRKRIGFQKPPNPDARAASRRPSRGPG